MKIIHTSDIHIDSPLTARLSPDKIRERRRELIDGFSRLVSEAKRIGAEAMIIAGDLFDSERISKRAIDTALDAIESSPGISFFYLVGNHEGEALMNSGRTMPKNLYTFGEDWTYYGCGELCIAGRSKISCGMLDSLELDPDKKNVVILHGELRAGVGSDTAIGLADLKVKNIDYLALGHYHTYAKHRIDSRGVAVYSGTPEGRGFDEAGDMGFVIVDTGGKEVDCVFKRFASRTLRIVRLDVSDILRQSEIRDRMREELSRIPSSDLIRVEICGFRSPELWLDTKAYENEFKKDFYYLECKDRTRLKINPDDYKYDKTLKGEFIRTVSLAEGLSDERRAEIISCGINALMHEDLF